MRVKKRSVSLSLSQQAYDLIRTGILKGQFPMGAPLSRRQLASQLGTSFLPVSEALQRLESEGMVESRPRVGTRVRVPTSQDIRGHYVIREALESQSARLFAERATLRMDGKAQAPVVRCQGVAGCIANVRASTGDLAI